MSLEDLVYELKKEFHKLQDSVQELKEANTELESTINSLDNQLYNLDRNTEQRFDRIEDKMYDMRFANN